MRARRTAADECVSHPGPATTRYRPDVRRGLLKDLANTPTQIACGWRLYGDLPRLSELLGSVITVDLMDGSARVGSRELAPPLEIGEETSRWIRDRLERDCVPEGLVTAARLTISPSERQPGLLTFECETVMETESRTFNSRDVTRWGRGDF